MILVGRSFWGRLDTRLLVPNFLCYADPDHDMEPGIFKRNVPIMGYMNY